MKRKVQKFLMKKNGLSDCETSNFLSAINQDRAGWKSERYRIVLDCGYYVEKEVNSSAKIFCPQPVEAVLGFQKDWKLLEKNDVEAKK